MLMAKLAIGGVAITGNVLFCWGVGTLFMGMGAWIGWPMLIICYSIVFYITCKFLGNYLRKIQLTTMTIVFIIFIILKINKII